MTDIGRSGAMGRPVEADKPPGLLYNIFVRNITAKIAASPMVAIVLIVFIGCTLWSVWFSFTDSRSLPNGDFVGWAQYERLFSARRWKISATNLLTYGIFSLVFTMVVGFLLAVLMDQKLRFEDGFRTIFLYPFALSGIVTGLVWQWIMNPTLGLQSTIRGLAIQSKVNPSQPRLRRVPCRPSVGFMIHCHTRPVTMNDRAKG